MIRLLMILLITLGCSTTKPIPPKKEIIFVDYQTYKQWGTTSLVPIGTRPLPTEEEICRNPLWIQQCYDDSRLKNKYFKD